MIQDIAPEKINTAYAVKKPESNALFIILNGGKLLLKTGGGLAFPSAEDIRPENAVYLLSAGEKEFFFAENTDENAINALKNSGFAFCDNYALMRGEPKWLCFAGITAYQLACWYDANRFCGRCGEKTRKSDKERMLYCERCGNMIYPKICPAVIVGVVNGGSLLMTKYADTRNGTRYALIAGFAEAGETIEETVRREVMEEVGVRVKNITYYKSQPWSFSDTLLLGFFCEPDGGTEITVDKNELSEALWMAREDMEIKDDGVSLTYEMMTLFKDGKAPL